MHTLTDPILHDCARIIERHPDLSPQYKARLMEGLATRDQELRDYVRAEVPVQDAAPRKAKR